MDGIRTPKGPRPHIRIFACHVCHADIFDDDLFCESCGFRVKQKEDVEPDRIEEDA